MSDMDVSNVVEMNDEAAAQLSKNEVTLINLSTVANVVAIIFFVVTGVFAVLAVYFGFMVVSQVSGFSQYINSVLPSLLSTFLMPGLTALFLGIMLKLTSVGINIYLDSQD